MTTQVTITNSTGNVPNPGEHVVIVRSPTGEKTVLEPGQTTQVYVWAGTKVEIIERDSTGQA